MPGIFNMKNLNESAKSRGVILFAFNSSVDYVAIADQTSQLITHNLKLPVTLITDQTSEPKFAYDQVIRIEQTDIDNYRRTRDDQIITWRNADRYLAYDLSPYEETILMDTDYLVFDDNLNKLFEVDFDYLLTHRNQNLQGPTVDVMGEHSLPFVWATVVLFRQTPKTKMFFDLIARIQRNYTYYRQLYNIRTDDFRNDYAFAIANIILNGYSIDSFKSVPGHMLSVNEKIDNIKLDGNFLKVVHKQTATVVALQNIHVLDKMYLLTDNFKQLVETACES